MANRGRGAARYRVDSRRHGISRVVGSSLLHTELPPHDSRPENPRADRNVGFRGVNREAVIRYVVGRSRQPAISHVAENPLGSVPHLDRDWPSFSVETRFKDTDAHRTKLRARPPVFFTGP